MFTGNNRTSAFKPTSSVEVHEPIPTAKPKRKYTRLPKTPVDPKIDTTAALKKVEQTVQDSKQAIKELVSKETSSPMLVSLRLSDAEVINLYVKCMREDSYCLSNKAKEMKKRAVIGRDSDDILHLHKQALAAVAKLRSPTALPNAVLPKIGANFRAGFVKTSPINLSTFDDQVRRNADALEGFFTDGFQTKKVYSDLYNQAPLTICTRNSEEHLIDMTKISRPGTFYRMQLGAYSTTSVISLTIAKGLALTVVRYGDKFTIDWLSEGACDPLMVVVRKGIEASLMELGFNIKLDVQPDLKTMRYIMHILPSQLQNFMSNFGIR